MCFSIPRVSHCARASVLFMLFTSFRSDCFTISGATVGIISFPCWRVPDFLPHFCYCAFDFAQGAAIIFICCHPAGENGDKPGAGAICEKFLYFCNFFLRFPFFLPTVKSNREIILDVQREAFIISIFHRNMKIIKIVPI